MTDKEFRQTSTFRACETFISDPRPESSSDNKNMAAKAEQLRHDGRKAVAQQLVCVNRHFEHHLTVAQSRLQMIDSPRLYVTDWKGTQLAVDAIYPMFDSKGMPPALHMVVAVPMHSTSQSTSKALSRIGEALGESVLGNLYAIHEDNLSLTLPSELASPIEESDGEEDQSDMTLEDFAPSSAANKGPRHESIESDVTLGNKQAKDASQSAKIRLRQTASDPGSII